MVNLPEFHQQLNRIRSLKKLEEMQTSLKEFLEFPAKYSDMEQEAKDALVDEIATHEEDGDHDSAVETYEEWKEDAASMLELVEKRLVSLGKYLARQQKTAKA